MSDTLQAIEYRRLVATIASHLSVEEVERITFVRHDEVAAPQGCDDGEPKTTALHMLAALERRGEFSLHNIDGLIEIVKDVNRHDLMGLVESYKKTRHQARKPGKFRALTPKLLRKHSSNSKSSKERVQLEEAYEMMVTRFTFLEQQMSLIPRLLEGEGDIQDEGTVILHSLKYAADELVSKLTDAHDYFQQLASDRDSMHGSCEDLLGRDSRERKLPSQDHQMPRSHREEEAIYDQPRLPASRFPPPPSTQKQLLVRPPIAIRSQHKPPVECRYAAGHTGREDDQDFTGDSGFSASTKYFDDSDPYCVVDLWRRPLPPTPPAAARKKAPATDHNYMAVITSNMNRDPVYDTVTSPPKTND